VVLPTPPFWLVIANANANLELPVSDCQPLTTQRRMPCYLTLLLILFMPENIN
jgi:hypothetical protein